MRKHAMALAAASLVASAVAAEPATCDAGKYVLCPAKEVKAEGSELDHVDLLGYSGMAFRVHALPRMMVCRSTVVCRYGYKPGTIKEAPDAGSAIELAARMVDSQTFGEYVSGQAAYALWISLLEADEDSAFMREQIEAHKGDGGLALLNTNCYQALVHARESAAPFLKRRAEEFTGERKAAVLEAADLYGEVVKTLKPTAGAKWENRQQQADAMRKAMDLEAKAAKLLKQASEPRL